LPLLGLLLGLSWALQITKGNLSDNKIETLPDGRQAAHFFAVERPALSHASITRDRTIRPSATSPDADSIGPSATT
jgi:hypothetical protein